MGARGQAEAEVPDDGSCAQAGPASSRGGQPRVAPGGPCARSKLWGPPAPPRREPQVGATSAHRSPRSSRTSRSRPQSYRAAELPWRRRGQCPRGRRPPAQAAWPRAPASGPARLQITPWLAAGAPAPARRPLLQLAAKFMPAALQWRPQSARSIPTARLRAARPEGGVSGV